jgi:Fic family protein
MQWAVEYATPAEIEAMQAICRAVRRDVAERKPTAIEAQPTLTKRFTARNPQTQKLLTLLENATGPLTQNELKAATGMSTSRASHVLWELYKRGALVRDGKRGSYSYTARR